jgi:hypothetical protein
VVEFLTLLLRILEVPGSILGPAIGYPDWGISWFSSVPGECRDSILKLGNDRFLPNPFQFINTHVSWTLYSLVTTNLPTSKSCTDWRLISASGATFLVFYHRNFTLQSPLGLLDLTLVIRTVCGKVIVLQCAWQPCSLCVAAMFIARDSHVQCDATVGQAEYDSQISKERSRQAVHFLSFTSCQTLFRTFCSLVCKPHAKRAWLFHRFYFDNKSVFSLCVNYLSVMIRFY